MTVAKSRVQTFSKAALLVATLSGYCRQKGYPDPIAEYEFHPTRQWRFDVAFPEAKVAIELEGGVWSSGRHVRGNGYESDCQKYTEAAILGWKLIRLTWSQVDRGDLWGYLDRVFGVAK